MEEQIEYKSGMGKESVLPPELKGWNWGAFLLNWVWGIGHSKFLTLLMFIPLVNVIMIFIIGAKGNKWAWQNRIWRDTTHFKSTQKKWAKYGVIIWIFFLVVPISTILYALKGDAYYLSLDTIKSNKEVIKMVGQPIESGYFVMGSIEVSPDAGHASLNYSITGAKGTAEVYVIANKYIGKWNLKEVVVYSEELDKQINVVKNIGNKE